MIQQQTFDIAKNKDELLTISAAMKALGDKRYQDAMDILVSRHDFLMKEPVLKLYDPRAA
jgi:hypothetical protein